MKKNDFQGVFERNRYLSETNKELREEKLRIISFVTECVTKIILPHLDNKNEVLQAMLTGLRPDKEALLSKLTPREVIVAILVGEGLNTEEIGEKTGFSIKMVEFLRENIRKKLGIKLTPKQKGPNLRAFLKKAP